jgi:hypothetical protein
MEEWTTDGDLWRRRRPTLGPGDQSRLLLVVDQHLDPSNDDYVVTWQRATSQITGALGRDFDRSRRAT